MRRRSTSLLRLRSWLPGLLLATFTGVSAAAPPPLSLGPAVNFPVGRSGNVARNAAVGDLDGDGRLDMAVPNSTDGTVSILLGDGEGGFTPAGAYSIDTGNGGNDPRAVAAVDLNEDGSLDLAVSDNGNDEVVTLLGNGDGTFQPPVNHGLGAGTGVNALAAGDFNRDGHPDLAAACSGSDTVALLRGNGNGTFQAATNTGAGVAGLNPFAAAAGDLDGDGDLDLAVANNNAPGTVTLLRNNGAGTFSAAGSPATADNSRSVALGDFDRDGDLDLAVANGGFSDVSVLIGNGNATFQPAVSYPAGSTPRSVAAADVDGDGALDLAVADSDDNFVYLMRGNGDGTFGATVAFMVGRRPDGVSVADINRDGRPDVVTANTAQDGEPFGSWNVSVLLNDTAFEPTGLMAAKVDYPAGLNPNALVSADFNGDGAPDLVAANVSSATVSFFAGVGDGTFAAAAATGVGTSPYAVTAGDFNRDGRPDLAAADLLAAGQLLVLLGNGDGTFQAPAGYGVGMYPVFVASGDFNRDGVIDLAAANAGSDDVSVLRGNGDGTFQAAVSYGVGATPYALAVADFDRDGQADVAVANYYSSSVSVLLGNGDGTFQLPADFEAGYCPIALAAADLDGDGALDLAVANYWSRDLSVLPGTGDGNFLPAVSVPVGANPAAVAVSDFFRDGKPDLAVACEGAGKVYVVPGTVEGTFLDPASFATAAGPASLVVGDFDRDGKVDLASANWEGGNVSVLLNWKDTVTAPSAPIGVNLVGALRDKGVPGMSYGLSTGGGVDSMGHALQYQFDWKGDGTDLSDWGAATKSNGWDLPGTYSVRARARCADHPEVVSAWSGDLVVDIGGPTISGLSIAGGAAFSSATAVAIDYTASASATHVRTATGGAWSAWLALPIPGQTVTLTPANGVKTVFAQVKDADGRVSAADWDTIALDTKLPTGVVKINGGSATVLSGGATTLVRVHLAMFDANPGGAQVRVKPDAAFTADPDPAAPWTPFDPGSTGQDVILSGTGVRNVYVQFMDGGGLKSVVYTASITVSATGAGWPGLSAVTAGNLELNDGEPFATSPALKLTYDVSQSGNIRVRYLHGTAWTEWETPSVSAGKVTKSLTLSRANGLRTVYVQLMETAGSAQPGAMSDPRSASITLDAVAPAGTVQINHGVSTLHRFTTGLNQVVLTILATDSASGVDKIAISQTGSSASATAPPPASSPDWFDYTPTVDSFGLKTRATGTRSVFVWIKDRAGKVSTRKVASVTVVP